MIVEPTQIEPIEDGVIRRVTKTCRNMKCKVCRTGNPDDVHRYIYLYYREDGESKRREITEADVPFYQKGIRLYKLEKDLEDMRETLARYRSPVKRRNLALLIKQYEADAGAIRGNGIVSEIK